MGRTITQEEICEKVDTTAATKYFNLHLNDFGPYKIKYGLNGRHLLIGGYKGHLASFEWVSKKLNFEINVMESIHDLCFLHNETMCAVAQKNSVFVYDNQGIELHCVKKLDHVLCMQFLPYHFLLATSNESGVLNWLDVSTGELAGTVKTWLGRLSIMTQNPYNAIVCLAGGKGVVSMWSPNANKPLAKMLCHHTPISAMAINHNGMYLATAGVDKSVKIFDLRNLAGPLQKYHFSSISSNLEFSRKNMLATTNGNVVEIYKDCCTKTIEDKYLMHRVDSRISNVQFNNFEDVLGVGHQRGFTSIIVPASSEPNFDSYEANPYEVKNQRKESEVKKLLEKIPADLISLQPTDISYVHVPTLAEKIEAKKRSLFLTAPKIEIKSKRKSYSSVRKAKIKKKVNEIAKMEFVKNNTQLNAKKKTTLNSSNVLDRFKA